MGKNIFWAFTYQCFHHRHLFPTLFFDTSQCNECLRRHQPDKRSSSPLTDSLIFLLDSADSKRRTRYAQKTQNPEWNQTVIYKNIHLEQVVCLNACMHRQTERERAYTHALSLSLTLAHTHNFQIPCSFAFTAHAVAYWAIALYSNSNSVLMHWPCLKCPCVTSFQNPGKELTSIVSDSLFLFIQLSVAVPMLEWLLYGKEYKHILFSNYSFGG